VSTGEEGRARDHRAVAKLETATVETGTLLDRRGAAQQRQLERADVRVLRGVVDVQRVHRLQTGFVTDDGERLALHDDGILVARRLRDPQLELRALVTWCAQDLRREQRTVVAHLGDVRGAGVDLHFREPEGAFVVRLRFERFGPLSVEQGPEGHGLALDRSAVARDDLADDAARGRRSVGFLGDRLERGAGRRRLVVGRRDEQQHRPESDHGDSAGRDRGGDASRHLLEGDGAQAQRAHRCERGAADEKRDDDCGFLQAILRAVQGCA
jgi:hypothetical protein